jgi:biotin carboxyl carrier protein
VREEIAMKCIKIKSGPDLWRSFMLPEGILEKWLVPDGSQAKAGDCLAEIRIEGALHNIVAPESGRVKIEVPVNNVIEPGSLLATLEPV